MNGAPVPRRVRQPEAGCFSGRDRGSGVGGEPACARVHAIMAIYPDLQGKSVVVTGGGGGIGAAITRHFVQQKARVTFLDIDVASSNELVTELGDASQVSFRHVDLRDVEALSAALDHIARAQGDVDVLVNNAGWDERKALNEVTPEFFDAAVAANLRHVVFASQNVIPGMRRRGGGVIVNFSSISWMAGMGGMPVYTAMKSAMLGLTRAMARDYGADNIRVNAIAPGWTLTKRQAEHWVTPESDERRLAAQCLKRWVMPDDIARFVLFLSSEDACMCTGQHYVVDGGWV